MSEIKIREILIFKNKNNWLDNLKTFFFPYYPIRFFKSIQLISLISFLFALHIILVYIGFNIPIINLQVGFDWMPTYLAGWFYGPIIGPIFGFIANNIYWLQTGGSYWYWMYSIQEPIVALFSSLLSYYYFLIRNKQKFIFQLIFQQFITFIFFIVSLLIISLSYLNNIRINEKHLSNNKEIFNLLIASLLIFILFFIAMEFFTFYKIKKKNLVNIKIFLFATTIIISVMFVFGIAAGPLITINYLYHFRFISNGNMSMNLYLIYSLSQVLMLCIKVPLSIIILYYALIISIKSFDKIKDSIFYRKQL